MAAFAVVGTKHAKAADQYRHLRYGKTQQAGAIEHHFLGFHAHLLRTVIAEGIGFRLHPVEAFDVGLFLRCIAAPAGERHIRGASLFQRNHTAQNDRIGKAHVAAQSIERAENLLQVRRLVHVPVLLRAESDPRAIGAAAMIGLAVCACRRPGRLDQLAHAQAAIGDLRLHFGNKAVRWHGALGHGILPDQVFLRHFRAEVADLGTHIAVCQLEPRAGKGIPECFVIVAELLADLAEARIALHLHVGSGHHGGDLLGRIPGRGGHVLFLLVDRLPLVRAGRRLHQLIIVIEQQAEVILAPPVGSVRPGALDTAGYRMLANTAVFFA